MDINAYFLSDLSIEQKEKINGENHRNKSAKHISLLTKRTSLNNQCIHSFDQSQNVITNVIEQFIPHSDIGRIIKQRISTKNKILPTTLSVT